MARFSIPLFLTVLMALSQAHQARAGFEAGVSIGEEGIESFYLSVGEYYRVPHREVIIIRERHRIPHDEIPVVFFLAHRARVSTGAIIDLRLGGLSWLDITFHYGLTPEIYYLPVKAGPPYGKAYGYYMNKPRKAWKKIVLADVEVVDLVNLRFISEHWGYPAGEVIRLRREGKGFININFEAKKAKKGKKAQGKNKGKGKGR